VLPESPSRPRLLATGAWNALAVVGVVVLVTSLDLRGQFHAQVRLSSGRWLSAPSAMTLLAVAAIAAALVGRRREVAGLVGLAGVSAGLAAFWLLLGHHRWAGPVLVDLGDDHGVHLGDFLALVPLGLAAALLWLAVARHRVARSVGQPAG